MWSASNVTNTTLWRIMNARNVEKVARSVHHRMTIFVGLVMTDFIEIKKENAVHVLLFVRLAMRIESAPLTKMVLFFTII